METNASSRHLQHQQSFSSVGGENVPLVTVLSEETHYFSSVVFIYACVSEAVENNIQR